ncbi:TPA: hypothetical protein ACLGW6_001871 [Salmonella enterica]
MNNLYNDFEKMIANRSSNSMEYGGTCSAFESKYELIAALSGDCIDYEIVGFRVPREHGKECERLFYEGDLDVWHEFCATHGKPIKKERLDILKAATLLELQGHHDLAQIIVDKIKADNLRSKLLPELIEKIQKNAHSNKQSEVAKKPRNKHHDEAIRIAKRTWNKYPHASKKGMCRKLYEYFHGQVSIDTLGRWVAKIKPRVKSKDTYFSLVL